MYELYEKITEILNEYYSNSIEIIGNYGWYLLILVIGLVYLYVNKIQPALEKYRKYKFEKDYAAKYHKNPDLFVSRVTAQQQYIDKLQNKYKEDAQKYIEKQEEKEQKKREEFLEKQGTSGRKLGGREDYNPLSGQGSSSNYRPQRKSPCGSGGCGR